MKDRSAAGRTPAPVAGSGSPGAAAPRLPWVAAWLLAALVPATHLLGAGPLAGSLWGASMFAFLPRVALPLACLALAAGVWLAFRPPPALAALATFEPSPRARRVRVAIGMAVAFAACWIFREGHTLLGDGAPLTRSLPLGQRFHPYQPLTFLLHHQFYSLAHGLFAGAGDPREAARGTVALSSAIAGALFVPTAWALAGEIARRPTPAAGDAASQRATAWLVFLVLIAQGYIQLFFGYVENYTFSGLVIALYLLAALRYLRGAAPLVLAGLLLVIDIALDLSGVVLLPSFAVLVAVGLLRPGRRLAALRDVGFAALLLAALGVLFAAIEPDYRLASTAWAVVLQALLGHGDRAQSMGYMFSGVHLRDFLNEQLLIGPAGSYLFVAGCSAALVPWRRADAPAVFVIVAGLASLAGAWAATDLGLGYPRDWDLFAPSGIVFTAGGLALALGAWRGGGRARWLALLACVSLFHTVPWVALNTSFERSFERFKTLPLGLGRTESAVGAVYLARGDTAQAIPWFQRSLDAYPGNNVAAFRLGQISLRRGLTDQAVRAFTIALRSRPDRESYRFALVDAIVRSGTRPEPALFHLDTLLTRHPDDPSYLTSYGVVWLGLGDRPRAAASFARARALAPGDSALFDRLNAHLTQPDGYARLVREDWPSIAGE